MGDKVRLVSEVVGLVVVVGYSTRRVKDPAFVTVSTLLVTKTK